MFVIVNEQLPKFPRYSSISLVICSIVSLHFLSAFSSHTVRTPIEYISWRFRKLFFWWAYTNSRLTLTSQGDAAATETFFSLDLKVISFGRCFRSKWILFEMAKFVENLRLRWNDERILHIVMARYPYWFVILYSIPFSILHFEFLQ